ncbi:MAG: ATP-dependent protease LonB [Bacilli bacterium]
MSQTFTSTLLVVQFIVTILMGMYFWNALKGSRGQRVGYDRDGQRELEQLKQMRAVRLNEPLSERMRPKAIDDIVGQKEGIEALRAAICSPYPQHVIIYGPPGVGKTAAARLILEEAKRQARSPFKQDARFIEMDATTTRFDERSIADPLIGSVHDPIYQGAGSLGAAGIPQPKRGAVSDAHGGVLFIDEIGELHPVQMNKLLKVLEDRKVTFESAYYSPSNMNIPIHIHDIFQNGMPADFRLIGATTRMPTDIPEAIRSRCVEVFFRELDHHDLVELVENGAQDAEITLEEGVSERFASYASNGRQVMNLLQTAIGLAVIKDQKMISRQTCDWVVMMSRLTPRVPVIVHDRENVGRANGLGVSGPTSGTVLEIEVIAESTDGPTTIAANGVVDEERIGSKSRQLLRRSMVRNSIDNVVTLLQTTGWAQGSYNITLNCPGGTPIDGPSAGLAIAVAMYSAIHKQPVSEQLAFTGEITIHGRVSPVGGVETKVEVARRAGVKTVFIPKANFTEAIGAIEGIEVVPVTHLHQVLYAIFPQFTFIQSPELGLEFESRTEQHGS